MAEYFGVARPTHPRPLHNAISTRNEGSACLGGYRHKNGISTSVAATLRPPERDKVTVSPIVQLREIKA